VASSSALRFQIDVPADRIVRLPDGVPVGHAEIVVVTPEPPQVAGDRAHLARELQAAAPRQTTDSSDLLRHDRDNR
jgi:hypothetical protein